MSYLMRLIKKQPVTPKALSSTTHGNAAILSRLSIPQRGYSESQDDRDKPVKFTTSAAAKNPNLVITDAHTQAKLEDMPWYHPHVSLWSLAIFMIYFFILREENDIDQMISGENTDYAEKIMKMQKEAMAKGINKQQ